MEFQEMERDLMQQMLEEGVMGKEPAGDSFESMIVELVKPHMGTIIEKFGNKPEQQPAQRPVPQTNGAPPPEQEQSKTKPAEFEKYLKLIAMIPDKLINKKTAASFLKQQKIDPNILKKALPKIQKISKVI